MELSRLILWGPGCVSRVEIFNMRVSGFGLKKGLGCTHLDEVPCLEILVRDRAVRHAAVHLRSNNLVIYNLEQPHKEHTLRGE